MAWVQISSAHLLSWLCCFHQCARCPLILLTRLDLFNKVYRRRKLHGELISRFTTRTGSEIVHPVLWRMSTFWPNRRTWAKGCVNEKCGGINENRSDAEKWLVHKVFPRYHLRAVTKEILQRSVQRFVWLFGACCSEPWWHSLTSFVNLQIPQLHIIQILQVALRAFQRALTLLAYELRSHQ